MNDACNQICLIFNVSENMREESNRGVLHKYFALSLISPDIQCKTDIDLLHQPPVSAILY